LRNGCGVTEGPQQRADPGRIEQPRAPRHRIIRPLLAFQREFSKRFEVGNVQSFQRAVPLLFAMVEDPHHRRKRDEQHDAAGTFVVALETDAMWNSELDRQMDAEDVGIRTRDCRALPREVARLGECR
jgi:hypothetical protein